MLSFSDFTLEMLQITCVLAGCDFLPSIKGIGFRKAHNLVKAWRTVPRVVAALKRSKAAVPEGYQQSLQRAVWGFRWGNIGVQYGSTGKRSALQHSKAMVADGCPASLQLAIWGLTYRSPPTESCSFCSCAAFCCGKATTQAARHSLLVAADLHAQPAFRASLLPCT